MSSDDEDKYWRGYDDGYSDAEDKYYNTSDEEEYEDLIKLLCMEKTPFLEKIRQQKSRPYGKL